MTDNFPLIALLGRKEGKRGTEGETATDGDHRGTLFNQKRGCTMKYVAKPQNLLEWIAVKANLAPAPMIAVVFAIIAKATMLAFKFDVFEAAKNSPQTLEGIAQKTKLHPRGLRSLMNILTERGYFDYKDGKFGLTKISRKWCLKESSFSLHSLLRYFYEDMWNDLNYLEEFLRTGEGVQVHDTYTDEQWDWYQQGMEGMARMPARQAAKMTPMPKNPVRMLDVGGSHGLYSVELCKKYPTLNATILDLPQAVERSQPALAEYNMGERVSYCTGNALTDNFGENQYDLILMSHLAHHFTAEQNSVVCRKAVTALKPGCCFVIQEYLRPETSNRMDMLMANMDMYFNLSSTSGLWSLKELMDFQQKAGLVHCKVNRFLGQPWFAQVCAKKE
jgi:ubiquinone/menaquinone biosynthesis C-methylase UbiE